MATVHAIGATIDIDMTNQNLVNHSAQGAPSGPQRYTWTTTSGNTITVFSFQDDITFNATEPTGGIVQAIRVLGSYLVGGVLGNLVSMTAAPNFENYWLPILAGQTTVLSSTNASFNGTGDFLFLDPGETRAGAGDLFEGATPADAADRQTFHGDAYTVANTANLAGGRDIINMRANGTVSGDANFVLGTLTGGDDTISVDGPIGAFSSFISGDVIGNSDGEAGFVPIVNGGDDLIEVENFLGPLLGGGGQIGGIAGDIFFHNAGQTTGGNDTIDGGSNDKFFAAWGDAQRMNGGTLLGGSDLLIASATEFVSLTGDVEQVAAGTLLAGADTLIGGAGGDTLAGDFFFLPGGAVGINASFTGADSIFGGDGGDSLQGQVGNDILDGGMGDDQLNGGTNPGGFGDIAAFNTLGVAISADLTLGLAFGQGLDTLAGVESLRGSNLNDQLGGDAAQNRIEGLGGADVITGRGGGDLLAGGNGNDIVKGFSGNDNIFGGAGADLLNGGLNNDQFIYNAVAESGPSAALRDNIQGFAQGGASGDRVNLNGIDARTGVAGEQDFIFIGAAAFSAEGQVRATSGGGITLIEANVTGLTGAEMTIAITGAFVLNGGDFVL